VSNLRDVSVDVPRDRLVVFTGVSGSGKSSLVFDTISTTPPISRKPRRKRRWRRDRSAEASHRSKTPPFRQP